jgi:hypothetical protein
VSRIWPALITLLLSAGILSANSVLTCGVNGGPLSGNGCIAQGTFVFNESLDWAAAFGSADTATNDAFHNVTLQGPWTALTAGGLEVDVTLPFNYSGITRTLGRADNFQMVCQDSPCSNASNWNFAPFAGYDTWNLYSGTFNSADQNSQPGAPQGDHLLYTANGAGPMELDFDRGINGVYFRISSPTSGDVVATIAAYSVAHPTALDIPIKTYTINATQAAGDCPGLIMTPPQPCNTAPYIGIDGLNGNLRSIIVSTVDTRAMYIDTLYLDSLVGVPEPAAMSLTAGSLALLALLARRKRN